MTDDCLFCSIVSGDVPSDTVAESDHAVAFRDVNPQAPTHVLVIPRSHYPDAAALASGEPPTVAHLFEAAAAIAESENLRDGYRTVFNTGKAAGQAVFHAHLHVLGGRSLTWPPG